MSLEHTLWIDLCHHWSALKHLHLTDNSASSKFIGYLDNAVYTGASLLCFISIISIHLSDDKAMPVRSHPEIDGDRLLLTIKTQISYYMQINRPGSYFVCVTNGKQLICTEDMIQCFESIS